jgi:uncharacterized protein YggE
MYPNAKYSQGMTTGVVVLGMLLLAGVIIVAIIRDKIVNQPWTEFPVTGQGTVSYTPDEAVVTVGVSITNALTAQDALSRLSTSIGKIVPAIQALGITEENISTHSYTLSPQYYYPENSPAKISGYNATQYVAVKLDISKSQDLIGKVIETANAQGANEILGVTFDVSNLDELKQQAILLAINDAKSNAEETAQAAGVRLDDVHSWWQSPISIPVGPTPYYNGGYGGGYGGDAMMSEGAMPTSPIVAPGMQEIIMEVTLNYGTK